ncbi:autoinducer binding domain-containing protein [Loktanella sp. SALINAS62]|uniref:helix-turn-helix transcriptional regulator n=1 Tax=Loktanella sp. SALINAS62 TaxID=2706124 RepID=UPI001B8B69FE|nr:autoinducer binding domain-containing protein [Loktanella sp. SALINAS62]MBS1301340.1 LuxR family transcriptional regulator [Loktanella sp. SALINAS62]
METRTTPRSCLAALEAADTLTELQECAIKLRTALGVDHLVYHWISVDGEQFGFGTYAPAWAQRYQDRDYIRIDPVVLGCFQRFRPVDWKSLDWSSRAARDLRRDALAHGIGNQGFSIPIRGPNGQFALFTVSSTCTDPEWDDFTGTHQRDLILVAHVLNDKALQLRQGRSPQPTIQLSPREVDALTFLAMGYARSQAAEILKISEHTLRSYIESARLKLGALNTDHAVARALTEGLIVSGGAIRDAKGDWPGRSVAQTTDPATALAGNH